MGRVDGRVAHLSTVHPPRDNRIFHKECRALQEAGLDVWLIIPQEGDENAEGIMVHGLPRRGSRLKRMLLGQFDAWRALNKVQPSLVQFHDPELIPVVALWKTIHRRKAVYDAHEDLEKQIDGKTYLPSWARSAARSASKVLIAMADLTMDGIVVATPHIATNFRNENTLVVHNYPWLGEFTETIDHEHKPRVMVYVGGLSEARGFSSMNEIVEHVPNSKLVLAGSMDGEVRMKFETSPAGAAVEYLGKLDTNAVPGVLEQSSLGLVLLKPLPNYLESLPTKLFEYMAAGIPFVATDFPYWRDLLEQYECGVFVDAANKSDCAKTVAKLMDDAKLRSEMGARGRRAVVSRFNFGFDAGKFVLLIQSLLEREEFQLSELDSSEQGVEH